MNQSHPIGGGKRNQVQAVHTSQETATERLRGGEEKVDEYMFWFWRPMGNLPDLEVWDLFFGETNRPVSQLFFMTFVAGFDRLRIWS